MKRLTRTNSAPLGVGAALGAVVPLEEVGTRYEVYKVLYKVSHSEMVEDWAGLDRRRRARTRARTSPLNSEPFQTISHHAQPYSNNKSQNIKISVTSLPLLL